LPARKAFLLRIRPELWDDLSRWAADELRSVNGHIEFLLREAVRERRRRGGPGPGPGAGPPDPGGEVR
jgi:hypothetical protein